MVDDGLMYEGDIDERLNSYKRDCSSVHLRPVASGHCVFLAECLSFLTTGTPMPELHLLPKVNLVPTIVPLCSAVLTVKPVKVLLGWPTKNHLTNRRRTHPTRNTPTSCPVPRDPSLTRLVTSISPLTRNFMLTVLTMSGLTTLLAELDKMA